MVAPAGNVTCWNGCASVLLCVDVGVGVGVVAARYRAWARQKAAILAKANHDRAELLRENSRLRAMLDPHVRLWLLLVGTASTPRARAHMWCLHARQAESTEARFRELDEERVRLEADVDTLSTTTAKLEAELKSVYRRWDEDGQRWAMERRRLQEQLQAQAHTAAALASASDVQLQALAPAATSRSAANGAADPAGDVSAQRAEETIAQLVAERDAILKNWSEETEILVTIWKQDKEAWAAEKARLQQLQSSRS